MKIGFIDKVFDVIWKNIKINIDSHLKVIVNKKIYYKQIFEIFLSIIVIVIIMQ